MELLAIDHPRFRFAQDAVFTRKVVADCMTHQCAMHTTAKVKLDACCQYGCDVDGNERDAILRRKAEIAALLTDSAAKSPWFRDLVEYDADMPSGQFVRSNIHGDGCIFLSHDRRGCAIHRAAIENSWDFRGTKPHVCRLFPLTYTHDAIVVSDDYEDYSCAYADDAPTLYGLTRDTLAELFGDALCDALDRAEAKLAKRRLSVVVGY